MSSLQKALFLEKKFGNFVQRFVLGKTEIYRPGPGEVLVKVQAASLNPVDWKIKEHNYGPIVETYPAILGTDIAGDVEELGEGVGEFKKGDKVFFHGFFSNRESGFQQYTTVPSALLAKIPSNLTYDQASALPVALSWAYIGLYNKAPFGLGLEAPISERTQGFYADTPFVILGGPRSVGQLVIQFAKLSGFYPIITTASPKHANFLKSLGATNVLDRNLTLDSLVQEINKISNGKPIKFLFDAVASKDTQQCSLDVLAVGGHAISTLGITVKTPEDKTFTFVYGLPRLPQNYDLCASLYHDEIYRFLEKELIKPNKTEVLPNGLSGIPDGLTRMAANHWQVSGLKLVIRPQETP